MTPEQIKSALADIIQSNPLPGGNGAHMGRKQALSIADALYEQVKPKPLVWTGSDSDCYMQVTTTTGVYCVGVFGDGWYAEFEPHNAPKPYSLGWHYDSALAAQAAAQSHADAARWKNTALADMIGGVK